MTKQIKRAVGSRTGWRMTESGALAHKLADDGSSSMCGIPEPRLRAMAIREPDNVLRLGCSRCYGQLAVLEEWRSMNAAQRKAAEKSRRRSGREWLDELRP